MYKKILVPLDGSDIGKCNLSEIPNVAAKDSEIVLLRVVEPFSDVGTGAMETGTLRAGGLLDEALAKNQAEAAAFLKDIAAALKKKGFTGVKTVVLEGKPAEQIIAYAERNKVEAVVLSTHGRSGISRWAFGSVSDKVMRSVRMPVLIVAPMGCHLDQE